MRFKTFLMYEVKYDGGIDVDVDRHGRITSTSTIQSSNKKDPRSEAAAADELEKGISRGTVKKASAVELSDAERKRIEDRKNRTKIKPESGLFHSIKKMIMKSFQ